MAELEAKQAEAPRTLLRTGIAGLDQVLHGGFLYHNSILLKGEPGTGKTSLGIQIVYNGAVDFDEPGIVVLFEQFPQQLYRDLASYQMDVDRLVREKKLLLIFANPALVTFKDQISESPLVSEIHEAALEMGAKRVLVDGVVQFINMMPSEMNRREVLLKFLNSLKSIGLTPIVTAEADSGGGGATFEEYLVDSAIALSNEAETDKTFPMRLLEVKKTRGQDHIRGRHPYRIGPAGVEVFPHLLPRPFKTEAAEEGELARASSGVGGLDDMLGGGYVRGASTIVAGVPGTFKTTLGVQFLMQGAEAGEPGLLLTFNENPAFLARTMKSKGLDLGGAVAAEKIAVWHLFPKSFYVDELLFQLERELAEGPPRRLAVDGINELERSIEDPGTYRDFMASFLSLLARRQATSVWVQKLDEFTGSAPLTNIRYAAMFDGIVYLATVELESAVHKAVSILKQRGGDYVTDVREIGCGSGGLYVLDKFLGLSGILAGNPQGQDKKTIEEIFQPLYFVRDFLEMLAAPELEAAQQEQIVTNLRSEVGKLLDKLREHYDIGEKK